MGICERYWNKMRKVITKQLDKFFVRTVAPQFEAYFLSPQFAQIVQENVEQVLLSDLFQKQLCEALQCTTSAFKELAEQLLHQEAVVTVTTGTLTGLVTLVGDDYLLLEEDETAVLIPFMSIVSLQAA